MKSTPKILFIVILFTSFLYAEILYVPSEKYPTIQAGIDSALVGDTVLVAENTYYENISFEGKAITVASQFIMDNDKSHISNTIIDGSQPLEHGIGSVVSFTSGEDSITVLCGFTLTGGRGSGGGRLSPSHGGGIFCENNSDPVLRDLIIKENWGSNGGGIYCSNNSNPKLDNLFITDNKSFKGAGLYCSNSSPIFTDVTISKNIARRHPQGSGYGGGIYCINSVLTSINVIVEGNKAPKGGGIYCDNSGVSLSSTVIKNNNAFLSEGGGIYLNNSTLNFDPANRCDIFLNAASTGSDIVCSGSSTIDVVLDTFTVSNPNSFFASPISNFTFDILNAKIVPINGDLYVNPTGNDNNSGLSPVEPLRTISCAIIKIVANSLNPRNIYLTSGIYSPTNSGENYPLHMRSYISLIGEAEQYVFLDAEGEEGIENIISIKQDIGVVIKDLTITGGVGITCADHSESIISHARLTSAGIKCANHSLTTLSYVSVLNTDGVGIGSENYSFNSHANINIYNSTFSGNEINCSFLSEHSKVNIVNTIFWSPFENEFLSWGDVEINVVHSNVGSDWGNNENVNLIAGNINSDPMFVDTANGDYRLQPVSPCIDAGTAFFEIGGDTLINLNPAQYIGSAPDMGAYEFDPTSDIKEKSITPLHYSLKQNYPNPFNPTTTINFSIPKSEFVELKVFNILGKEVSTLVSKKLNQGNHTFTFDGKNLASGIYYYQLVAGEFHQVKKMILLR